MAFVVPAEIGHATYSAPLLEYLAQNFGRVHLTALREKLFADLSEDVWLLFADDYGSSTARSRMTYTTTKAVTTTWARTSSPSP